MVHILSIKLIFILYYTAVPISLYILVTVVHDYSLHVYNGTKSSLMTADWSVHGWLFT